MEDPHETLAALDGEDDECLYIDRPSPHDAYIWADPDAEETTVERDGEDDVEVYEGYTMLTRTSGGMWRPRPEPIRLCDAVYWLEDADADNITAEIRPQTKLPPGRHPTDRQ